MESSTNIIPYIIAAYGVGLVATLGYSFWLVVDRYKLIQLKSTFSNTDKDSEKEGKNGK